MKKIILIAIILICGYSIYSVVTVSDIQVKPWKYTIGKWDVVADIPARFSFSANSFIFKIWQKLNYSQLKLQAGTYTVSDSMNVDSLFSTVLKKPDSLDMELTILPGWNIFDIDDYLTNKSIIRTGDLVKYSSDNIDKLSSKYEFLKDKKSLEWFLFPDTYRFGFDVSLEDFISMLLDTFNTRIYSKYSENKDFYNKLILASIVEREEKVSENKKIVAWILQKRLDKNMPIWADATVCYSYKYTQKECTPAFINSVIYKKSPYNTRSQIGLPPTPISSISEDTIDATFNPESSEYYYYLHDNSWEIHYAKTLDGHNKNKNLYLK